MNSEVKACIIKKIVGAIEGLLNEEGDKLFDALRESYIENGETEKFKFPISFASHISPDGDGWNIKTVIGYGIKRKASTEDFVEGENQIDLVQQVQAKKQ